MVKTRSNFELFGVIKGMLVYLLVHNCSHFWIYLGKEGFLPRVILNEKVGNSKQRAFNFCVSMVLP